MNTLRGFIDPLDHLPRRHRTAAPATTRGRAARAWWSRFVASMPKSRRPSPGPALTLVLWSSSVEGIAAEDRARERPS